MYGNFDWSTLSPLMSKMLSHTLLLTAHMYCYAMRTQFTSLFAPDWSMTIGRFLLFITAKTNEIYLLNFFKKEAFSGQKAMLQDW